MRLFAVRCLLLIVCVRFISACAENEKETLWDEVSGDKALAHVQALVDLGPRPPGTEALRSRESILRNNFPTLAGR